MTILSTLATEEGVYAITRTFVDQVGTAFTPNAGLNWTLTDTAGNVVNSRSAVSITPGTSVTVVLSGDDLALLTTYAGRRRVLIIEGTYSGSLGTNLPFKFEAKFDIQDLVKVT
jgi:hypothetical protein